MSHHHLSFDFVCFQLVGINYRSFIETHLLSQLLIRASGKQFLSRRRLTDTKIFENIVGHFVEKKLSMEK